MRVDISPGEESVGKRHEYDNVYIVGCTDLTPLHARPGGDSNTDFSRGRHDVGQTSLEQGEDDIC